ncbi:helix-turn-helix domain-containing protein [Meridianimarinicoccus sp. RP-17]|uniref:helix-turn-helix domain-containing protein n=1 Tax=Meridianimarinicoccus zhengii TaxID=2056810 RepID=UPI000DAE3261|nr:helix-turn-helix transcriptional regulator [Phycocomes zhengii]
MAETDEPWFTPENSTLGDRLAGAREAAGMTRAELARRMGLKLSTIDKWEDDLAEPRANRLQMLSGLLGVSLTWLLTAEGDGPGPSDEPLGDDLRKVLSEMRQVRTDLLREAERIGQLEKRLRSLLKEPAA